MSIMLPQGTCVLVADARKALFLKNTGTALAPALATEATLHAPDNPRSSEQGVERPGRTLLPDGRKSGMEPTDFHALAEDAFAREVAATLEQRVKADPQALVIAAPPKFLAALRTAYGPATRTALKQEIDKDLVKLPVRDILHVLVKG